MSTFNELIDFTRSTTGTYLDSVVYGDELVTNGTFDSDTGWTKGTGWTISGGTAVASNVQSGVKIESTSFTVTAGYYTISLDVTTSYSSYYFGIQGVTVAATGQKSTQGTVSITTYLNAGSHTAFIGAWSSGLSGTFDNVSVKEVIGGQVSAGTPLLRTAAINEPRLEYDASGNPLGLLIEEARTNVLLHSEDFTNANWGKTNLTATANAATAPDNTQTADKLQLNSTTAGVYMVQDNSTSSSGYKTVTVYAKDNNAGYVILRVGDQPSSADRYLVLVDLSNGHVVDTAISGNPLNVSHTVTPVGNNWYRVSVTANLNESGIRVAITPYCVSSITHTDGTPENAGGAVGNSVYIWGAQLEQGAFPTSYIPTSGSTVTRAADVASLPVERFAYNQSKGSVVVQATYTSPDALAGVSAAFGLDDGTSSNRMWYYANKGQWIGSNSGSTTFNVGSSTYPIIGVPHKTSVAYKVNDFPLIIDGAFIGTDTSSPVPVVNSLGVGKTSIGTYLNGHLKSIQYYPKRLSNTELQLLTQPSASPTMNLTFDGQATSTLVEGFHD